MKFLELVQFYQKENNTSQALKRTHHWLFGEVQISLFQMRIYENKKDYKESREVLKEVYLIFKISAFLWIKKQHLSQNLR